MSPEAASGVGGGSGSARDWESAPRAAAAIVALAIGLAVPAIVGVAVALIGDHVAYGEGSEEEILRRLAALLGVSALASLLANAVVFVASWRLARLQPFSSSVLAQPVSAFAALRIVAAILLGAAALWPELRQPVVGLATALIDAAFVAVLLLLLAQSQSQSQSSLSPERRRSMAMRLLALVYVCYRLGSALASFLPGEHAETAALAHRLFATVLIATIAGVLLDVARDLRRAAARATA